jgi:RNA polymerase sigma-70 factor (ECF subfamily)
MAEMDQFPDGNPEMLSHEMTDHSLIRHVRLGSQDAADQLYKRYAFRLRELARAQCSPNLARREEIEDIVQSVFGSFFRGANKGYYDVPAGEELWKLFLVIALNKIRAKGAYHQAAKRDIRRTVSGAWCENSLEQVAAADESAQAALQLTVDETLDCLPNQYREVLRLRIEGFEIKEIAQKVGRSRRTVERLLQESRKRLAELLQLDE